MFFEDKDMILKLNEYFTNNYYVFELADLFTLMKLHAYCFHKPEQMYDMLHDSIELRVKQQS
jgi:hypothetical protein